MTPDEIILSIAFGGSIIFFVSFSILNRKRVTYPIHNIFWSFILGLIFTLVLSIIFKSTYLFTLLAVFLYSLFAAVHIFAIYLNLDSSLHMRIFQEVAKMGSKGLTYTELLHTYNTQIILKKRLMWLVHSGEIEKEGSAYYLRRRHSLLILREEFLHLLGKLYGS